MAPFTLTRHTQQVYRFVEDLNGVPLEMIYIPSGTFTMGAPQSEAESLDYERSCHPVTVPSFFIGRYPVTQAQWRVIAEIKGNKRKLDPDPSEFKGDDRPVERVSWEDAIEFCQRLSQHTHRPYDLTSEAEWEYACRAGTDTPFHFGETITTDLANYDGNYTYGDGAQGNYREETTPVNHFQVANAFGLSDMHGNVWEWCLDHWHDNYDGAPTDGSAWLTKKKSASRVRRGGSWLTYPRRCRSAYRGSNYPDYRDGNLGFRVVCRPPMTL